VSGCSRHGNILCDARFKRNSGFIVPADIKKVAAAEIGPIADYIAMLALSEPRSLDECYALSRFLDLMADGWAGHEKPNALNHCNLAYLKSLYAADLVATTNLTQKESIEDGMKGEVGK